MFVEGFSLTAAERFAPIDGARLFYEVAGHGDQAILFVHAGVADCRMWEPQVESLSGEFTVVRYDMRGFGRSPMPDGPFAGWSDLVAIMDAADVRQAHIVGASMGGAVALDLALMAPERVRSLTLVAAATGGHTWSDAVQEFGEAEEAALEAGEIDQAVELNLRMWVDGPHRTPEQVDASLRTFVGEMQRHAFLLPMGAGTPRRVDPPALRRLYEMTAPTLVVVGALDQADPLLVADQLAEGIRGAQKVVMEGCAHLPSLEQPALFNALLTTFLQGAR